MLHTARLAAPLFLALTAACATRPPAADSPAAAAQPDEARAWLLLFHGPFAFQVPTEIASAGESEPVRARFLANIPITFDPGTQAGDAVRLRARAQQGAMSVTMRMGPERATGSWHADHWIGRFLFRGGVVGVPIPAGVLAPLPRSRVADSVVAIVRRAHFDPAYNGMDLERAASDLRTRIESAATDGEAVEAINAMLRGLGSSHVGFGAEVDSTTAASLARLAPPRAAARLAGAPVRWRQLAPDVGYLKISSFPADAAALPARAAVDSAFAQLGPLGAMVIDLRGNGGGHLDVADRLASHLASRPFDVGVFASQRGVRGRGAADARQLDFARLPRVHSSSVNSAAFFPRLEELGGAVMMTAGGGAARPYCGRVVVLINGSSASTTEAVAGGLRDAGIATLVGTRTAGAMLASAPFTAARGWTLRLPVYDYRTAAGARVEGAGIAPDVVVRPRRRGDAPLQRALELFRSTPGGAARPGCGAVPAS